MKVIFLDIDGVLNYKDSEFLDKACLSRLSNIVNETGAKIVIISTWRVAIDKEYHDKYIKIPSDRLVYYEKALLDNLSGRLRWIGIAPDLNEDRSAEIALWLSKHPDVTNYVIIDDYDYDYGLNYPNNWVRTSWFTGGLTDDRMQMAISILNSK